MRDALPARINKMEAGIVNLDDNVGRGTHWTAYVKRNSIIFYFDSVGHLRPPLEVIKYFRSNNKTNTIMYNSERYQSPSSYICGHLCLQFLYTYAQ